MFGRRIFGTSFSPLSKLRQFFHTCVAQSNCADASKSTVFALSSAPGKAGLAVLRISGINAAEALRQLARVEKLPPERKATLRLLYSPHTHEAIDRGLMLWFPGPNSFTGEDCVEFHVHGGSAVVAAMLAALGKLHGFRHAEQGEFTKRAFLNGKLDLTAVEGLADLIEAETESQRKQSLRHMEGELGQMYNGWREALIKCLANVEAFIDFDEADNIEDNIMFEVETNIRELKACIDCHLSDNHQGERLRLGVRVAILGQPNVGKSSLLNAICRRQAAIVSPIAGTTRDVIETALNIGGYPVVISDTAGLRDTQDSIEKEGVKRALNSAEKSDLKILVVDVDYGLSQAVTSNTLRSYIQTYLNRLICLGNTTILSKDHSLVTDVCGCVNGSSSGLKDIILVINKSDLLDHGKVTVLEQLRTQLGSFPVCLVSCASGHGLDTLLQMLLMRVKELCGNPLSGSPRLTQARHRTHLTNCSSHLTSYLERQESDVVLAAEHLKRAAQELGKVIGKISPEDILDVIFRDFCIGK